MRLADCRNIHDFRLLAKKRLPSPIFHYIDGAADDEVTYRRNTQAYEECDLVPNVLKNVETIDISTELFGKKLDLPIFLSPTALQRLFHYQGERAVANAAAKFNALFGISSLATVSIEEIGKTINTPKMFQLYVHKDEGLTRSMIDRCKAAKFDALTLTVDTIVGGNRERDLKTGFTSPPKFTLSSILSYMSRPAWVFDYLLKEPFSLPQLDGYVNEGTQIALSVADYFNTMLDQTMDWQAAERIAEYWGGHFVLKGIMSVHDAKKAAAMGASAIMVSNHGGRQLDGSRAPFDQLAEIVDAVGDKVDVICDGGIQRGSHVLKALAIGAKACSGGRWYLYALAGAGQKGVERALENMQAEIVRDAKLMGCDALSGLTRDCLRFR